jgi:hypothetical protein
MNYLTVGLALELTQLPQKNSADGQSNSTNAHPSSEVGSIDLILRIHRRGRYSYSPQRG